MSKTQPGNKTVPRPGYEKPEDPRKQGIYRNREFLDCVGMLGDCVVCHAVYTMAAHSNQSKYGKGRGIKSSDAATMSLCYVCHASLDNGKDGNRASKEALENAAIIATYKLLRSRGMIAGQFPQQDKDYARHAAAWVRAMETGAIKLNENWRKL